MFISALSMGSELQLPQGASVRIGALRFGL